MKQTSVYKPWKTREWLRLADTSSPDQKAVLIPSRSRLEVYGPFTGILYGCKQSFPVREDDGDSRKTSPTPADPGLRAVHTRSYITIEELYCLITFHERPRLTETFKAK